MAWDIQGDGNGVWIGYLSDQEYHNGGIWLIGQDLPDNHPGKVDCDPLYKTWVATESKYGGEGHITDPAQSGKPAHGGRLEYVQVMTGQFAVEVAGRIYPLSFPSATELPADVRRVWKYVDEVQPEARGITVCRTPTPETQVCGCGQGYTFAVIESQTNSFPRPQILKLHCSTKRYQFVEVFTGALECTIGNDKYRLEERGHMFIPARREVTWSLSVNNPLRAVTLSY